jgi:ATP-grasp domain-containing protein
MADAEPITVVCLASHYKGGAFLQECKRQGCHVILLTREKLAEEDWPRDSIDEMFFMSDLAKQPDITFAVSYLARTREISRVIPLDDYDVETAAALREHLRLPGMGATTAYYFRDKLAMRVQARDEALPVPDFVPVFNYAQISEFMTRVPPPWLLKPRSEAGAMGIRKIETPEALWRQLEELGDRQSYYVLERFLPGDVFHVDSIISEEEILYAIAHQYARPPLSVSHEGGIFSTRTVPRDSIEAQALLALNREVIRAFGMVRGVTHAEYLRGAEDGRYYFIEAAARVGGANIAELVEFATGINLWAEWAKLELADQRDEPYALPSARNDYAGIVICLARQEYPDTSNYQDPEIVWRMNKKHHAGLIVASLDPDRVRFLVESYSQRFASDFLATLPPRDKPE